MIITTEPSTSTICLLVQISHTHTHTHAPRLSHLSSPPDGPDLVALTPPTPPPFIKLGSDFNLTCSAVSSPAATFQWYRNQQLMETSGSVLTQKTIQDLGLGSTAGQYSCSASNSKTRRAAASAAVSFALIGEVAGPGPDG